MPGWDAWIQTRRETILHNAGSQVIEALICFTSHFIGLSCIERLIEIEVFAMSIASCMLLIGQSRRCIVSCNLQSDLFPVPYSKILETLMRWHADDMPAAIAHNVFSTSQKQHKLTVVPDMEHNTVRWYRCARNDYVATHVLQRTMPN